MQLVLAVPTAKHHAAHSRRTPRPHHDRRGPTPPPPRQARQNKDKYGLNRLTPPKESPEIIKFLKQVRSRRRFQT